MYTRFTTLTNELKSLGRIILKEYKVEKILTRVLPVTWKSKITAIQESKNIATLKLDELIRNLTTYELRRQTMKMDAPKKERSLALRIVEGADLKDDEMAMITRDSKNEDSEDKAEDEQALMSIGESDDEQEEHEDEAIGLVKELSEVSAQAKDAPKEETGVRIGSSIQGNLTGGTEQRRTETNPLMEPVHDPVPRQQKMEETSSRNQLVNLCAFDAFLSLIKPKNVVEALQDAYWVNAMQDELNQFERSQVWDVELPKLGRSGGKKKFEKEKERKGKCGDVMRKGKGVADSSPTTELPGDELGLSVEETLTDLLKKVGASYDPKKRRTPTLKAPSAPKPSKKRKASSPTTTETSFPKGIATRSRVKQSESDLQQALAKNKKKRMDKGKGKVAKSSEAIDVEEMEQVHQEDYAIIEVQTPKPKKTKTYSKKFSSMFEAAKPSLAKRTRSAVKNKQVRISEDEEWSGEEENESDGEQDKLAKFGKRKILNGRLLKDLVEP
ncbi:uncharacterized protein [Nicotiana sylvestris]|uniref:uncharacterized protein n=1 Tax=Nicotiana sylvestris TaxID=4096 RepID=UPI00388C3BDD